MQNRLRIWSAALLAVVTTTIAGNSARAQLTARSAVDGRQRVRTALAVAVADGTLSSAEEDSISRLGKGLLTPQELPGLERTLSRLAGRQHAPLPLAPQEPVEDQPTGQPGSDPTTQTGLPLPDKRDIAETASFQEPAATGDKPAVEKHQAAVDAEMESPFQEESAMEGAELMDDDTLVFEGGHYNAFPGMLAGLQSLAADGWSNLSLYTTVDAFKGPLDLDDRNGNFGLGFGLNTGIPLASRLGIGLQAGTSAVLSNFYGTQFTGSTIRSQNFTTAGIFQQVPFLDRGLKWGCAYDWLNDDYYTTFTLGQWRVKLAYELDPCREIGVWACIPDKGDTARLGSRQTGFSVDRFKPVTQGSLYYRRCWQGGIGTTAWLGLAEEPGQFVFGSDARVPLTGRLALVGNFNYVLPSASARPGQDEEMWNVSLGIELTPCWGANRCHNASAYAPLFPLANNGTFAVRRF